MKNILKFLSLVLIIPFFINSCASEDYRDWETAEPSFTLYDTTIGSNVLYPSMENNTFRLAWDNTVGTAASYDVVYSTTSDFAVKIKLGTSTTNSYTTTIGALNTALLQAGYNPYSLKKVFFRVEAGTNVSNAISFDVTPYPVSVPVITAPTAGSSFTLSQSNEDTVITGVNWTDYESYGGVKVTYKVEVAKKGTSVFETVGTVENVKTLSLTHKMLNDAVLKVGLLEEVEGEVDLRITAQTTTVNPIDLSSNVVTIKVKPYKQVYVPFYLVGGGTAVGWNASNAQLLFAEENLSTIYTYLEKNGQFRFLGQQDWNPINYSLNTDGIRDSYKFFKTWSSNLAKADNDENILFTGESGVYKIVIDQKSSVRSITVTPSSLPSVPTNLYLVGSINGWDANNALAMTPVNDGVFEYVINIPNGAEFKFIGQQSWGDLEWANIHSAGNTGYLGPKGDNNNIKFDGGGNSYKITANIKKGIFTIVQQ